MVFAEQQNRRQRMNTQVFFGARKRRRERVLRKMATMRAAKERRRMERGPREDEPHRGPIVRHPHLSWAVRDDLSGDVVWMEMKSARDTFRRVTVLLKFYQPGKGIR